MGDSRVPRDPLLPTHWFNILHDRPQYVTSAVSRSRLAGGVKAAGQGALLQQPLALARQSINTADRYIPIPDEVLDLYAQYRPTPLRRAVRLEDRLGANARIYYKYEGANLTGSHKLNTALAQAYYYSRAGVKHLVTGTAAGQWGTALAYACQVMNLGCTVFMVRSTLRQKPIRGDMMRLFGAVVHESPTVSSSFEKMGLRTSPMGEITLHDCVVSAESRLGPEGAGMAIFNSSMDWERSCLFGSVVGGMRRQLEACVGYARSREQFGKPIGKFQGVSDKLADMYVRLEAARSLIYRVAWLKQQGRSAPAEAAAAKLFISEAWVRSSQDAIQVHGAWGYLKDAGIERDLRDAVAGTIYSGTSEIQRVVIARMLGL